MAKRNLYEEVVKIATSLTGVPVRYITTESGHNVFVPYEDMEKASTADNEYIKSLYSDEKERFKAMCYLHNEHYTQFWGDATLELVSFDNINWEGERKSNITQQFADLGYWR